MDKSSIEDNVRHLKLLNSYIGDLSLEQVHGGTLKPFIEARLKEGKKTKTINLALSVVRRVLNLAATEWIDEHGLTWLAAAPRIKLLSVRDAEPPRPLTWDDQERFFSELPRHLRQMVLYKVNTGCREQEVCQLQWEWEVMIPDLETSVFIIPGFVARNGKLVRQVKNGCDRVVVLNRVAKKVIDEQRSLHPKWVFPYHNHPVGSMNNTAWQAARAKLGIKVRVHDLKHTFGCRLRAAGVTEEDRRDLLGHKSRSMTTHYSAAQLMNLIEAANKACDRMAQGPLLTLLRNAKQLREVKKVGASSHQFPTKPCEAAKVVNG